MIDKRYPDIPGLLASTDCLRDGATVLIGGFGDAGVPQRLVEAVAELGLRGLTLVSNNAGVGDYGIARLLKSGAVSKVICSFPRSAGSYVFEELYAAGRIELELVPQGTLAERIRAGGAGIPAFYTPTAVGTTLAEGRETRQFNGRTFLLEQAIRGDLALIHAARGDRWGNLVYSATARNFNPVMATAATTTLAEVRQFVPALDPEQIVTPGIFVGGMVEVGDTHVATGEAAA